MGAVGGDGAGDRVRALQQGGELRVLVGQGREDDVGVDQDVVDLGGAVLEPRRHRGQVLGDAAQLGDGGVEVAAVALEGLAKADHVDRERLAGGVVAAL